jgi:hypothetical protein
MLQAKLLIAFLITGFLTAKCQQTETETTKVFSDDMKKLVALNSSLPDVVDLRHKEAVNIMTNATARQMIEITEPYLQSTILNAKTICLDLLNTALFKKPVTQMEKQEIVELLCKNWLNDDRDIQLVDNSLLRLSEKDFNPAAKTDLTALILHPRFSYALSGKLLAVAQIKASIPTLWKVVNRDIATMTHSDIDILASLARMNEKEAGKIICEYYNSTKNRTDYRYIFISTNLVFSLDSTVLDCMIKDFKTMDIEKSFRDGDSGYYPAGHLGANIVAMLKNYPFPKQEFYVDTKQLLNWLNQASMFELEEK